VPRTSSRASEYASARNKLQRSPRQLLSGPALGLLLTLLLGACASTPQTAALLQQQAAATATADSASPAIAATQASTVAATAALPPAALIDDLPFFAQDDYQCGPAALATMLLHSGIERSPEDLVPLVYVPGRKGSFQIEMSATARQAGLLVYTLQPSLEALLQEVAAGHPVLVLQNLALDWLPRWHFAVVKGYDLQRRELLLNSGRIENYRVKLQVFERTWARAGHWAQVLLPPAQLPATASPQPLFQALAALQEVGQTESAAQAYDSALQRWPDDSSLLLGAGNLHYSLGNSDQARAAFLRVTRLQPDSAPAHNNLAVLLLEQGEADAALPHAERAVALGGEFASFYEKTLQEIRAALE
jgi:tetratricopeptide (TPR) repeat protein